MPSDTVAVRVVDDDAFGHCDSLSDLYYAGTRQAWDALRIGEGNAALESAAVHCSGAGR